jgi:hypothetical protein
MITYKEFDVLCLLLRNGLGHWYLFMAFSCYFEVTMQVKVSYLSVLEPLLGSGLTPCLESLLWKAAMVWRLVQ